MKAIDLIRAEQYRQQQEENTHDSTGQTAEMDWMDALDESANDVGLFLDSYEVGNVDKRHLITAAARLATIIDGIDS